MQSKKHFSASIMWPLSSFGITIYVGLLSLLCHCDVSFGKMIQEDCFEGDSKLIIDHMNSKKVLMEDEDEQNVT